MKLEDLVPPLYLCRKIPDGKFEDSCFVRPDNVPGNPVWTRGTNIYFHELKCGIKMFPAPTLQEIMEETKNISDGICVYYQGRGVWAANGQDDRDTYGIKARKNPATAALKLWLELNKG